MVNHTFRSIISGSVAAVLAFAGIVAGATPANAVGAANVYWIADDLAWNQQVFSGNTSSLPVSMTQVTMSQTNNPGRGIGSDGTYLYYADNTNSSLIRSNLDGTNRIVVANLSGGADGISVAGGYVYWSSWSGGIMGIATSATAGTPTVVVAPGSAGLPSSGFSNVTVLGSDIYFSIYDGSNPSTLTPGVGLYHGTIAGLTATAITKNADVSGLVGANPGAGLVAYGSSLYMISNASGRLGIIKTTDWSQALSTWTYFDTSSVSSWLGGIGVLGTDIFITDAGTGKVYSMTTAGASLTEIYGGGASLDGYQIVAITPPSATVTFDSNGGTGSMSAQTASATTALTSNSFSRTNAHFLFWNDTNNCSSPGTIYNNGANYGFASNVTLYACWAGDLEYSLSPAGPAITSIDFGSVAVGSTTSIDVYLRNSGAVGTGMRSSSFSNSNVAGSYVTAANSGSTCPSFSGGSLALAATCKTVVTYAPSAASTLTGTAALVVQYAGVAYTLNINGSASAARVVTFNANGGTGALANQSSSTTANLTANANGITRAGFTFAGWNTSANGSGTAFADAASYNFTNSITLYAQWTAIPISSGGSIDSTEVRIGGISSKVVDPTTPAVIVTGFNLEKVTGVQVNGIDVKFFTSGSSISIALAGLTPGTSPSITISGKGFKISLVGALRVVEKYATSNGNGGTQVYSQSFSVFFAPGSSVLTAAGRATLAAKLASVKRAISGVIVTGWTQDTGNNKGDLALATSRAKVIVAWFKNKGISAITASARGTETKESKSRRADISYAVK